MITIFDQNLLFSARYNTSFSNWNVIFQYVDGGNLEQVIEKKERDLPWSLRMSLALDVAKGLSYLHARGWFHRDLTSKVKHCICIRYKS